jgi:hypothetical protein
VQRLLPALALVLIVLSGCGSSDAAPGGDDGDTTGQALACLESNDIAAQRTGENENELVLDAGPRIKFFLTAPEAEAAQFQGKGEGAEQIGSALLFVDPETSEETDDILHDVEVCLSDL